MNAKFVNPDTKRCFIGLWMILLLGYFSCKPAEDLPMEEVQLNVLMPMFLKEGDHLKKVDDTLYIQYVNDTTCYRLPYFYQWMLEDSVVSEEKRFASFIYRNHSDSGYYLRETDTVVEYKKFPIDSIVGRYGFRGVYSTKGLIPIGREKLKGEGQFVEKYTFNDPSEDNYDSVNFFFDKSMMKSKYSLSPSMDSQFAAKLYRVQAIFIPQVTSFQNMPLPRREYLIEYKSHFREISPEFIRLRKIMKDRNLQL